MRYSAFISYNHRDRKTASWLHRALETYRIPRRLQGRQGALGEIGARLPPLFQDREELAASSDLAASVREALEQSATLIVLCSPDSAASRWVNEEIRSFTALGRRDRIQCLIVGGVPDASRTPGLAPSQECLPPALFENGGGEPLAADIRPGADDRTSAKLKLLAGILGVGYDELRQREHARRHRQLAVAAGVSALGFLSMTALAGFAVVSRNDAVEQRDIARKKTLTAERTVDFVKSLFKVADPSESRGDTITAREILDRGAQELDQSLGNEPTVKAELSTTLGEVYGGLGMVRRSKALLSQGLQLGGVDAGARARQYVALGTAQWRAGEYDAALASDSKALTLARAVGEGAAPLMPRILQGFSVSQMRTGDHAAAKRNAQAALALDRQLGAEPPQIAFDMEVLGQAYFYGGDLSDARSNIQQALDLRLKTQGKSHPLVADDLNTLGSVAYMQHDSADAERNFRQALAGYQAVLGPDHQMVASALNNLARILLERRSFAEAEQLLQRALTINLAQVGDKADDLIFEYTNLGMAHRGLGRLAEADATFAKAEPLARLHKHRNLAPILVERAEIACLTGATARGLQLTEEARPIMAAAYKKDAWRVAWVDAARGDCLGRSGRSQAGSALLRASAPIIQARWKPASLYGSRLQTMLARAGLSGG